MHIKRTLFLAILYTLIGCVKEEAIPVIADFEYEVVNEDFSVPVQIVFFNRTEGAETYEWRFWGGSPSVSIHRNPGIIRYDKEGTYEIELTGTNQDGSIDSKIIEIQIDAPVTVDFEITNLIDNFSPAVYTFQETALGENSYFWTFNKGVPSTATGQDPGEIIFTEPGEHIVTLEVSNGRETYTTQKTVTVAPHLKSDFFYQPNFDDDDYQVPVSITLENTSVSATSYEWSCSGATPSFSNEVQPEFTFTTPGNYTLSLTASNGKETETTSQNIEVFENTNLRILTDVQLGINTAHAANTVGSFFSIASRQTYYNSEITTTISASIDLVFFGLNENFTRNRFVSPNQLESTNFSSLLQPKNTIFINSQELCNCSASLTSDQFDMMTDDTLLDALDIEETEGGLEEFDGTQNNRIVLFETQEGKKGAIKIKDFINDGQNSYILVDIKVQKESL
ncbi:PKD domain-containing protein [Aquimarina pacifica]|uniref:PKD domain-containing protein n=1 Tax=Aquimarina pacifica TaxID=1296415 RepID=UPI00046EF9E6|nr:PKD domain-containing protein [Aquimarina pacifica]